MEMIQAMTNLSSAAQTLLNFRCPVFAATVLRAAVDQVVPAGGCEAPDCCLSVAESIRADFLALAAELESLA